MTAPATNSTAPSAQTAGETNTGEQLQLVTFEVASEEFAVDILAVHEINRMMELTRVPQSPPDVEGVVNLRGRIVPVVALRRVFGMPDAERTEQSRIIVVEVAGRVLGFIVDRVHEVLRIGPDIVDTAPQMSGSVRGDFIRGVAKLTDRLIILLDLNRLFAAKSDLAEDLGQVAEAA